MDDPNQPSIETKAKLRWQLFSQRKLGLSRYDAETLQFLALVDSQRPALAALLAFARLPVCAALLIIVGVLVFGDHQSIQQLTALILPILQ